MSNPVERLRPQSGYSAANAAWIEALYERFLADPASVSPQWREHFARFARNGATGPEPVHSEIRARYLHPPRHAPAPAAADDDDLAARQTRVLQLINAHRVRGHRCANVDPLNLAPTECVLDLDPNFHGLTDADLASTFNTGSLVAPDRLPLREILEIVREVYSGTIGSEYMHITDTEQKRWLQARLEGPRARLDIDAAGRRWILDRLTAAEGIERYLHNRYVGQKRFSLEGGESLIPLLDELIQRAGTQGVREIVIGMAHRGRLNVLVNILGKSPATIFDEFEGRNGSANGSGDVKYHMGFSSAVDTPGGPVHLALAFNPSHLEIVNPVVLGSVRARQDCRGDMTHLEVLPVLIHGDAAFAGQGVVMETLNMSQTHGYKVGGTVHIVVNNQIGFTTSDPYNARSTAYCTDVAKMVQAPIFHVNGDDPEAVLFVTRIALDYCNTFNSDVLIDLVCYRRHGHNEADEPAVTQPVMYRKIRTHPTVREIYAARLAESGDLPREDGEQMVREYRDALDRGELVSRPVIDQPRECGINWKPYLDVPWTISANTGVDAGHVRELGKRVLALPDCFRLHPRVERIWSDRTEMLAGEREVDWGMAETLAYATLLDEGYGIRLSGQDSGRGTFFHRHAVIYDQKTGKPHVPLWQFQHDRVIYRIIDSLLSEEAVLGFEYGYATADPHTLVLWEAQFGDFANGAQVVIDQFISSGEAKWGRLCGLVMLLPHGYEGQGPEHSSARPERYMQLCAEHNIQLCQPSTPAQVFHMLRRQMLRPFRHPLIVLTGKSLLRHKRCTSPVSELTDGEFQTVIDETTQIDPARARHLVFCSGRVYFDLIEAREARGIDDVPIIRIEQLYPFPHEAFDRIMARYGGVEKLIWCQDEPQNQGYWDQIKHRFYKPLQAGRRLFYAGRPAAASPATGYSKAHAAQRDALVEQALTGEIAPELNRRRP